MREIKARNNGNKEIGHPKSIIEIMSDTREAIENYGVAAGLSFAEAAQVLILNELRCIHWHYDKELVEKANE